MNYNVVTICRNEEEFISDTVENVLSLKPPPMVYVVVDDGSSDRTGDILDSFTPNINVVHIRKRVAAEIGVNMVFAFMRGVRLASKKNPRWKYLLKVDADTRVPSNYSKYIIERMEHDEKLGIASGTPKARRLWEDNPSDGAKIYRRECWEAIGGLYFTTAFDTYAIYRAKMLEWKVGVLPISFNEVRKPVIYGKPSLRYWFLRGKIRHRLGFNFLYTFLSALRRAAQNPILLGSLTIILTFLCYIFSNQNKIFDEEFYIFMNQQSKKELYFKIKNILIEEKIKK